MASYAPPAARGVWIALSIPIAVAVAIASAAGAFVPATYLKETPSWSAQGVGQDFMNLFVIVPVLLFTGHRANGGSVRALLVWLGLLLYLAYSYVLYAFFIHFGPLFLVYVSALGLSFYALVGTVLSIDTKALASELSRTRNARVMSTLLMTVGVLFALLWLGEIAAALARGAVPSSVTEVGLPVNPIHVLDLALLLPGVMMTAVLLWRRNTYGFVFAAPLGTFLVAMGLAIIAMVIVMRARGVSVSLVLPVVVGGIVVVTSYATTQFLKPSARGL
jgi:hypothetical protein